MSRNPDSGKILLMESGIPGFGIRNTAQGIANPNNEWNPESKTVLDFLTWGDVIASVQSGTETVSSRQI